MIDLTKIPPFANAAWVNEPNAPCLWCAGTGHVNGNYVGGEICDCPDTSASSGCCECGDPQCDGDAQWLAKATADIAEQLADSVAELDSPLLKLIKERNEARRLCALLAAAIPDLAFAVTSQKAMDAANNEMHQALMAYVKTRKEWDERSWK